MIFQLWKIWFKWASSCTTKTLLREQWAMIGEYARRSVGKLSNTIRLLHHNSHFCYVSRINALFKAYRCAWCGLIIEKKTGNLERHLTTCKERVKQTFPKNVYQLRETLIDNLTCLISLTQTIENSSKTWSFLTLNQSVWKIKISRTTKQQHGLGNTIPFRHQFNPTWYKNPFSSAILIFVTWYHLPLMLWRVWLHTAELKWKGTSFKLKPQ